MRRWPNSNWGLACDGWLVVDLDGDEGIANWAALTSGLEVPATLTSLTGGGGRHLLFADPAGEGRNTTGQLAAKVDTKAAGGYIVIPPSVHPNGTLYQWQEPQAAVAAAPDWLLDLVRRPVAVETPAGKPTWNTGQPTTYGVAVLCGIEDRIQAAPEGERNTVLAREAFRAGQWVAGGELPREGVLGVLINACPDPDRRKVRETATRQYKAGLAFPRRRGDLG